MNEITKTIYDTLYKFGYEVKSTNSTSKTLLYYTKKITNKQRNREIAKFSKKFNVEEDTVFVIEGLPMEMLHCENSPARIRFHDNGMIWIEEWWIYGRLHREDGFAVSYYDEEGMLEYGLNYREGVYIPEKKNQLIEQLA